MSTDNENRVILEYVSLIFAPTEVSMLANHRSLRSYILREMLADGHIESETLNQMPHSAVNGKIIDYINDILQRRVRTIPEEYILSRIVELMRENQGQATLTPPTQLRLPLMRRTEFSGNSNNATPIGRVTVNPNNIPPTERRSTRGGRKRWSSRRSSRYRGKKTRRS